MTYLLNATIACSVCMLAYVLIQLACDTLRHAKKEDEDALTDHTSTEPCDSDGYTSISAGPQNHEKTSKFLLDQSQRAARRYFYFLRKLVETPWWHFRVRYDYAKRAQQAKEDAYERSCKAEHFRKLWQQDQAALGYHRGCAAPPAPLSGEHRRT